MIYRDFLASPEEREELQVKDAEELRKIEKKMQEQYDVENIWKKSRAVKKSNDEQLLNDLVVYKEPNFLSKLFSIIKGIFNKNKF